MTPIVVGMTEPHPCERVSSFLGKSSLMNSKSAIVSSRKKGKLECS
jgi:hypothetical protein